MASYSVEWKRSAEKDIRKIDPLRIPAIIQTVETLAGDLYPTGCRKLHGTDRQYRVRIGDYRVIYEVHEELKIVIVYHIRHRKDAYRR